MIDDLLPNEREFDALGASILDRSRRADRRRRRRTIAIGTAITLAAAGVGTGWAILANEKMREHTTYCYEEADLDSRLANFTSRGNEWREAGPDGEYDPATEDHVGKCALNWRSGGFQPQGYHWNGVTEFPVPELELCLRPDGIHAVFPADPERPDLCRTLGLREPLN